MKQKNADGMGLGNLGSPNITFARRFRFEVVAPEEENFPTEYVNWAKIDYHNKKLTVRCYDLVDDKGGFHIHKWVDSVKMKRAGSWLSLRSYDGCGVNIMTNVFDQLEIIGMESSEFDYASSAECYTEVTMSYKLHSKHLHSNEDYFKNYKWSLSFRDTEGKLLFSTDKVLVDERPKIYVEETEINRLNAKFWLPGKASMLPVKVCGDEMSEISKLFAQKKMTADLTMYENKRKCEQWILEGCLISKINPSICQTELELRYDGIKYKNLMDK